MQSTNKMEKKLAYFKNISKILFKNGNWNWNWEFLESSLKKDEIKK